MTKQNTAGDMATTPKLKRRLYGDFEGDGLQISSGVSFTVVK